MIDSLVKTLILKEALKNLTGWQYRLAYFLLSKFFDKLVAPALKELSIAGALIIDKHKIEKTVKELEDSNEKDDIINSFDNLS